MCVCKPYAQRSPARMPGGEKSVDSWVKQNLSNQNPRWQHFDSEKRSSGVASAPLLREVHTVYPVGGHSDTHLVTGFAVNHNLSTVKWMRETQGEVVSAVEKFNRMFTCLQSAAAESG